MPPIKTTHITGKLTLVNPERQQYRPYNYQIEFDNVMVDFEIADDGIAKKGNPVTLNLKGFTSVIEQLCDAIDKMHDDYVNSQRKAGKF